MDPKRRPFTSPDAGSFVPPRPGQHIIINGHKFLVEATTMNSASGATVPRTLTLNLRTPMKRFAVLSNGSRVQFYDAEHISVDDTIVTEGRVGYRVVRIEEEPA